MRLLVCGSRTWEAASDVRFALEALRPSVVIHGAAKGADAFAGFWGERVGAEVVEYPADWKDGKGAGPIRNARMLREGEPTQGLAFGALWKRDERRTSGKNTGWKHTGTGDMVQRLLAAKVPVRWVAAPGWTAVDLVRMPGPEVGA